MLLISTWQAMVFCMVLHLLLYFTFMHLEDAFIQSDLQWIQAIHVCQYVFLHLMCSCQRLNDLNENDLKVYVFAQPADYCNNHKCATLEKLLSKKKKNHNMS